MAVVGGAIAAGAIGGIFSAQGASRANKTTRQEAALDRQFQERMSSTAVRRRMHDMRKAGINPLLAGKFEASSPSGRATGAIQNVGESFVEGGSKTTAAALSTAATKSSIALQSAQTQKTGEEAETIRVQREGTKTRNIILKHGEAIASVTADIARTVRALIGGKSPEEIAQIINEKIAAATSAITNAMESTATTTQSIKSKLSEIKSDIAQSINDSIAPGRNFNPNSPPIEKTNMQKWRESKSDLSFAKWLKTRPKAD